MGRTRSQRHRDPVEVMRNQFVSLAATTLSFAFVLSVVVGAFR